jgi:hypothetical protein
VTLTASLSANRKSMGAVGEIGGGEKYMTAILLLLLSCDILSVAASSNKQAAVANMV